MMAVMSMVRQFRTLYGGESSPLNGGRFRFLDVNATLEARVAQILEEQKIKPVELATVAGVSKGLVSQWMDGSRKSMGFDAATRINRRYGYAIAWLMKGDSPKMASDPAPARGADVSDQALEIARAWEQLSAVCQDHVRRQIALLQGSQANSSGRRKAAEHDVEIKGGALRPSARSKTRKGVR